MALRETKTSEKVTGGNDLPGTVNPDESVLVPGVSTPFPVSGNTLTGYRNVDPVYQNYRGGDARFQPLPLTSVMQAGDEDGEVEASQTDSSVTEESGTTTEGELVGDESSSDESTSEGDGDQLSLDAPEETATEAKTSGRRGK